MKNQYLPLAKRVAHRLDQHLKKTPAGLTWDISHSFAGQWRYYDEASLYAGASGIIKFYLLLAQVSGETRYFTTAYQAGQELAARALAPAAHLEKAFSKYAYTTGLGGVAQALAWLDQAQPTPRFAQAICQILQGIVAEQRPDGAWSGQIGIVADGGTALLLGHLAPRYQIPGWQAALRKFGAYVLRQRQVDAHGQAYYVGLNLNYVGGPAGKFNTGFPLGPAGVAYTLLKLAAWTGEDRFTAGVTGIREFYEYYGQKEAILLPHYHPDTEGICYVGYCGGPVGVARYFYQLALQQDDRQAARDFAAAIAGLDLVQAPAKRSAGYWQTENYCCGTAGILNLQLGAYLATGQPAYLTQAQATGQLLVNRAVQTTQAVYWHQAFERKVPTNITAALGYYDGAAGIASQLLELGEIEQGHLNTHRLIDDPYPATWKLSQ